MRIWNNSGHDEGSRHAIGNGHMLVYGIGPNLEYVYGPPYSSPPFISMNIESAGAELSCETERVTGSAVWKHRVRKSDRKQAAIITDYMLPDRNLFVRDIEAETGLRFRLEPLPGIRKVNAGGSYFGEIPGAVSFLFSYAKGPTFLAYDPVTEEGELLVTVVGGEWREDDREGVPVLRVLPGKSRIVFAAGFRFPDLIRDTAEALLEVEDDSLERTMAFWHQYTSRRTNFDSLIPDAHPRKAEMLAAIDSVSVLLKCQQSSEGGGVPGHRYSPMAYVRDLAGVLRGYLALGYREEARAILQFWKRKWERFGNLENAEGVGDDSVRLSGGNNEVEVPALMLLCCFEYDRATGDEHLLRDLWPAMEWAFSVQLGHLAGGMLEFSSDETYIAGGVFPRRLIFQGSAEATLMFVTGGARLLEWAQRRGLLAGPKLAFYREKLEEAERLFKRNFVPDGVLYANQPARARIAGKPKFLFGFCDAHGGLDGRLVNRWLELQEQGYYLCAECRGRKMPEPAVDENKLYELNSVNLIPLYIGSELFTREEAAAVVKPGFDRFAEEGKIPSDIGGTRSLGYDCGLMLYNAAKLGDPIQEKLLDKVLSLLDPAGAWAEYYDDDKPADCCRARPWESAMNIEGIAAYIRSLNCESEVG
ncbi:hypothetical protein [Cohnella candidum]|uniref:Uncharacterized protein n=1 Tax=Cohnella candidum TaxID=2674991 RepID=A0A3G3JVS7_9BACL|nr:hypothetical protein [Cohnella candidum]AYQ72350.1 hypothetical protein EAV92_07060 [Cohnella candidum]